MPEDFLAVVPPAGAKPSSADGFYPYTPSMNLVYLTGIDQPGTWLLIQRRKGGQLREDLFIAPYDEEHARWVGRILTKEEASSISGVENISFNAGVEKYVDRVLQRFGVGSLWVDFPIAGVTGSAGSRLSFAARLRDAYPHLPLHRLSDLIFLLRMRKDPSEIDMLKEAIGVTGEAFRRALGILRPGLNESEFETELLCGFMRRGEKQPAFEPIVAGGGRATCLHYTDNDKELEEGTLLLVDFGAKAAYYNADITRTVPVSGRYTARQRELMEMVLTVQEEAIRLLRPGKLHAQWNDEVKAFYAALMVEKGIIPEPAGIDRFYYHNVGHHLGLDTHDESSVNEVLAEGMVLTVEPGFYSAEEGIGIRIEDDVVIGAGSNTVLSAGIPRTPDEIETLMAGKG
jgi:Xaa-Pro aminopeptidase